MMINRYTTALALLLLNFTLIFAQINTPEPAQPILIIDGIRPANLQWSNHAPLITFRDSLFPGAGVNVEFNTWYQFSVNQGVLAQGSKWPLQVPLPTAVEAQALTDGLTFISPNSRYLIFSTTPEHGINGRSVIKIYDLASDLVINTVISSGGGARTVGYFDVIWGADDRFVMSTIPESGGLPASLNLNYVHVEAGVASFQSLTQMNVGTQVLLIFDVIDISSDGLHILLRGGIEGEFATSLVILDVQNPSQLTFIPPDLLDSENVLEAQFTDANGNEFIFFSDQGIGYYALTTGTIHIINSQLTANSFDQAKFSSDAGMIAVADDTSVYWLDLRPLQPASTPVPTLTPVSSTTYSPAALSGLTGVR